MPLLRCYRRYQIFAGSSPMLLIPVFIYYITAPLSQQDITNQQLPRSEQQACQHPVLDVYSEDIIKYFTEIPPLKCDPEPDWVKVKESEVIITDKAKKDHGGDIECSFTEFMRVNDDENKKGKTTTTHDKFTLVNSDFFEVTCKAQDGKTWNNVMAGIRDKAIEPDTVRWDKTPSDGLKMNVLIVGFDSISHNTFIRSLPKAYRYLTEKLGAQVMEGYNIVGDGTPQALIPILTGKMELELPETRRNMRNGQHVNIFPFIWQEFKNAGYVTLYAEDQAIMGTFNYRLRGFNKQPTDHYMRPFYINADTQHKKHPKYCLRGTPKHKVMFDYTINFMDKYRDQPKFGFALHSELSHGHFNLTSVADDDLVHMMTRLKTSGHLDNTVLIVMSDHGARFVAIRSSQQGKQEERLPFFSFVLPPSLKEKFPSAIKNFRENKYRLATPYDIYPTLHDVLHFSGARTGSVSDRGISLFSKIPPSRTCADAGIPAHWCTCLSWGHKQTDDPRVKKAAESLISEMNSYTESLRSVCKVLTLSNITWAGVLLPSKGMMAYKKAISRFNPDFSDNTTVTEEVYEIHVTTHPNGGFYEASMRYNIRKDTYSVKIEEISRTNKYGSQAHCIMETHDHLRKFCYCVEPPP